jgi:hypothetical protein
MNMPYTRRSGRRKALGIAGPAAVHAPKSESIASASS